MTLYDFITTHSDRTECRCGKCFDRTVGPDEEPTNHSVSVEFFTVSLLNPEDPPSVEEFEAVLAGHTSDYVTTNPFPLDAEQNYMTLGAFVGDQGVAMQMMALGHLLGMWKLLTPMLMFGDLMSEDERMQLAGRGMVSIMPLVGQAVVADG